jgi:electron transfer flavoprotein alpha subunit
MGNKVLVYVDQFKGEALAASWETLGAGRSLADQMGGSVVAQVVGPAAQQVAAQAFQFGADEALFADDATLKDYRPEPYAALLAKVAGEQGPDVVLFPTTTRGRELAAMAAIDLKTGVLPDVIHLELQDGKLVVTRPVYAGKLLCKAYCDTAPVIITTRVRAFTKPQADSTRTGTPVQVAAVMSEDAIATKVKDYAASEAGVSLTDAGVIVSGGRGLSNNPNITSPQGMDEKQAEIWRAQQGFKLVNELALVLGGAVGASRAAVDAGYISYDHQVGQTGKVVSPDLYVACGISGAIQHLAGMRTSKVIVAINKDPDAPIFKLARFGVVGDLFAVLPPLIETLRQRLGK